MGLYTVHYIYIYNVTCIYIYYFREFAYCVCRLNSPADRAETATDRVVQDEIYKIYTPSMRTYTTVYG